MTQSGQGEEPSARQAREGIVLPSDGGEPLLPGMTGDRAAPAGGRSWGQQWGPAPSAPQQQDHGTGHGPGQGWSAPAADGNAPQTQTWEMPEASRSGSAPAPDWGTPERPGGWDASAAPRHPHAGDHAAQGWTGTTSAALPPEGAPPASYGTTGGHPGALPPQHAAHSSAPLPPVAPADEGATQYIPPVPAHDDGATQYIPPVAAAPDEGATQYIPPVGPGALPPEVPADATQYLGRAPHGGAGPLPPTADPDAQATQYIAPVPAEPAAPSYGIRPGGPEDRQPPAEFDNLFRSEQEGPASTQQLPKFDAPRPAGAPQAGPP
ncbi:hypothetical protein ACFV8W_23400, partial [Streptomyces sp. NPDC059786]